MNETRPQIGPDDPRLTAFALYETAGLSQSEQIEIEAALAGDPELRAEMAESQAVARRIALSLAQALKTGAPEAETLTASQRAAIQAEAAQGRIRKGLTRWFATRTKGGAGWRWRSSDRWPSPSQWLTFALSCTAIAFMLVIPVSRYTHGRIRHDIVLSRYLESSSKERVSASGIERAEALLYVPPLSDFLLHQDRARSEAVRQAATTRRSNLALTPAQPAASSGAQDAARATDDRRSLAETAAATRSEAGSSLGAARRIIKDGNLVLEVSEVELAAGQVETIAAQMGGYVIESGSRLAEDGSQRSNLRVAVPVEQFESAHGRIRQLAQRILEDQTSGVDVSEEYVDLESEIANLEATESQVREFLRQSSSVEESLKVNARLTEISGEIALRKGRLNYLADRTAFSTLSVALQAPAPKPKPTPVSAWSASRSVAQAIDAQVGLLQQIADALIWVTVLGGPYLALAVSSGLFFAWRRERRGGA